MAHDIFGSRFLSHREPAWHGLGEVTEEELPALVALERMGEPVYSLEPIYATVNDPYGEGTTAALTLTLPERAIVMHPTLDDPEFVSLGIAGVEYELFTPGDLAAAWDEAVARPVETMEMLARGGRYFITGHIEDVDIRGDEVSLYQYALIELDGLHANEYGITGHRIVCANTLKLAQDVATERFRIVHDRHVRERMRSWMANMNDLAVQKVQMLREAFGLLAAYTVTDEEINEVLDAAYPVPVEPRRDCPDEEFAVRLERWDARREQVATYRDGARGLFLGAGTGMNLPATEGTAWGLYNAVVETEDYRRWSNRSTPASVAESRMFGERAATKERAYSASVEVASR